MAPLTRNQFLVVAALLGGYGGFSWWSCSTTNRTTKKTPRTNDEIEVGRKEKIPSTDKNPQIAAATNVCKEPGGKTRSADKVGPINDSKPKARANSVKSSKAHSVKPSKGKAATGLHLTAVGGVLGAAAVAGAYVAGTLIKQSQDHQEKDVNEGAGKIISKAALGVAGLGVAVKAGNALNRLRLRDDNSRRRWLERLRIAPNNQLLEIAPEELRNDREAVLIAVNRSYHNLEFASEELRNDQEILAIAIRQWENNWTGQYFLVDYEPDYLQNNREAMLIAVNRYGMNLRYASEELRNDREVATAAVRQSWRALRYASPQLQEILRDDENLVLECIRTHGIDMHDVSLRLRNNPDVMRATTSRDPLEIVFASDELLGNREFIQEFSNRHHAEIAEYDIESIIARNFNTGNTNRHRQDYFTDHGITVPRSEITMPVPNRR